MGAQDDNEVSATIGSKYSSFQEVKDIARKNKIDNKVKHDSRLQRGLQHIGNVFIPLLPGIIAAGLINGTANHIDYQSGSAFNNDWWYMSIKTID